MANYDSTSSTPFDNTALANVSLVSASGESVSLRLTPVAADKTPATLKLNGAFGDTGAIRFVSSATLGADASAPTSVFSFPQFVPSDTLDFNAGLRSDRLWSALLAGDDWFMLGSGADRVNAFAGDDYLNGGAGNDALQGGAGNDTLDGGSGVDEAVFAGNRAGYAVSARAEGGFAVQDNAGTEGTDTLIRVERARFADAKLAFDLDGAAGSVARILGAVLGPAAVQNKAYVGIGLQLFDGGASFADVMQLALNVVLGPQPSNTELVGLLWRNLFGHAGTAAEIEPYADALTRGTYTQVTLATIAANLDLNAANVGLAGLAATGLEYL